MTGVRSDATELWLVATNAGRKKILDKDYSKVVKKLVNDCETNVSLQILATVLYGFVVILRERLNRALRVAELSIHKVLSKDPEGRKAKKQADALQKKLQKKDIPLEPPPLTDLDAASYRQSSKTQASEEDILQNGGEELIFEHEIMYAFSHAQGRRSCGYDETAAERRVNEMLRSGGSSDLPSGLQPLMDIDQRGASPSFQVGSPLVGLDLDYPSGLEQDVFNTGIKSPNKSKGSSGIGSKDSKGAGSSPNFPSFDDEIDPMLPPDNIMDDAHFSSDFGDLNGSSFDDFGDPTNGPSVDDISAARVQSNIDSSRAFQGISGISGPAAGSFAASKSNPTTSKSKSDRARSNFMKQINAVQPLRFEDVELESDSMDEDEGLQEKRRKTTAGGQKKKTRQPKRKKHYCRDPDPDFSATWFLHKEDRDWLDSFRSNFGMKKLPTPPTDKVTFVDTNIDYELRNLDLEKQYKDMRELYDGHPTLDWPGPAFISISPLSVWNTDWAALDKARQEKRKVMMRKKPSAAASSSSSSSAGQAGQNEEVEVADGEEPEPAAASGHEFPDPVSGGRKTHASSDPSIQGLRGGSSGDQRIYGDNDMLGGSSLMGGEPGRDGSNMLSSINGMRKLLESSGKGSGKGGGKGSPSFPLSSPDYEAAADPEFQGIFDAAMDDVMDDLDGGVPDLGDLPELEMSPPQPFLGGADDVSKSNGFGVSHSGITGGSFFTNSNIWPGEDPSSLMSFRWNGEVREDSMQKWQAKKSNSELLSDLSWEKRVVNTYQKIKAKTTSDSKKAPTHFHEVCAPDQCNDVVAALTFLDVLNLASIGKISVAQEVAMGPIEIRRT